MKINQRPEKIRELKELKFRLLVSAVFVFLVGSCADKKEEGPESSKIQLTYSQAYMDNLVKSSVLVVVDEANQPLPQAQVLIGPQQGVPFKNNFLVTNDKGILEIPSEWTTPQPVTVQSDRFLRLTLLNLKPEGHIFRLKSQVDFADFEVSGITTGHSIVAKDNLLDFGLVLEAMTKEELLTFDVNRIISPFSDVIRLAGFDFSIPGNIAIPRQKENYILPLTIEKPKFRLRTTRGPKKIFAARGVTPFKQLVSDVNNEIPYDELINNFNILGGGLQNVDVQTTPTVANINTKAMDFTQKTTLQAPALKDREIYLAATVSEDGGLWFPVDLKRLRSKESTPLKVWGSSPSLVGVIKNKDEFQIFGANGDRLSAFLLPLSAAATNPQALPLIENPRFINDFEFTLSRPINSVPELKETGTLILVSNTRLLRNERGEQQTQMVRQWEIFSPDWIDHVNLPQWPSRSTQPSPEPRAQERRGLNRRLEVVYIGFQGKNPGRFDSDLMLKATHVTRSSTEF